MLSAELSNATQQESEPRVRCELQSSLEMWEADNNDDDCERAPEVDAVLQPVIDLVDEALVLKGKYSKRSVSMHASNPSAEHATL